MPLLCIQRPHRTQSSSSPRTQLRPVREPTYRCPRRESASSRQPVQRSVPNAAQLRGENKASVEPKPSKQSREHSSLWQDIRPPKDLFDPAAHKLPLKQSLSISTKDKMLDTTHDVTSLPGYNDVSGAVVVDWNGMPHFLSPQEELERTSKLKRAVQERMLGLSRHTDFAWERPCHGATLPRYSPPKEKRLPRDALRR